MCPDFINHHRLSRMVVGDRLVGGVLRCLGWACVGSNTVALTGVKTGGPSALHQGVCQRALITQGYLARLRSIWLKVAVLSRMRPLLRPLRAALTTPSARHNMARIIGAIATSHTPTIGFALDQKKRTTPSGRPFLKASNPCSAGLRSKSPMCFSSSTTTT